MRKHRKAGDALTEVVDIGEINMKNVHGSKATERLLKKLENPPDLGKINGQLSREEIYEDIT